MADTVVSPKVVMSAEGVTVRRGGRAILHEVTLSIVKGTPFAIVGRSGSGKTTLLMALSGLRSPDEGRISVASGELGSLAPRERARRVGMVFQDHQLFPHLTVRENVTLSPRLAGEKKLSELSDRLFEQLGLAELRDRRPHELSGGQRQRVAIARALILSPEILLFDEPSAALDAQTTRELAALLLGLGEKTQVVLVSHDLPFVEQCCERGVRLEGGKIAARGALEEILER